VKTICQTILKQKTLENKKELINHYDYQFFLNTRVLFLLFSGFSR